MIATIKLTAPWGEIQPVEREDIGFKSTFGTRPNVMQLSIDSVTLVNEDREEVWKWIYLQQGRFENIPVLIQSDSGSYEYFLNLKTCQFNEQSVSISILPRKGHDHFFNRADSLSFEAVNALSGGVLQNASIEVPYLIVRDDLAIQTLVVAFTIYSLTTEIIRTIKAITDLAGQAADVLGTGVLTTVIQAVALALYLATLIVSLISFMNQLIQIIFPKIRYLNAIRDLDLIRLSVEFLGYSLESSLLDSLKNWYTMPVPITREQNRPSFMEFLADELANTKFNYGYPTANDTIRTLGEAISSIETMFNAETVVYDGVVRIETRATFIQNANAILPDVFNEQSLRENAFSFDIEQDWKRKVLSWTVDYSDAHTSDNFYKASAEYSSEPIQFINSDLVEVQCLQDIIFPFALAQRKSKLTRIENFVKGLLSVADFLANLFGGSSSLASKVQNREGVMIISQDTFSITKKLYIPNPSTGKQASNFIDYLAPSQIYDTYHKDMELNVNSGRIYENMPFPCTEYEFNKFNENKFVILGDSGQVVELISGEFVYNQAQAIATFKQYDDSGFNTKTIKIY